MEYILWIDSLNDDRQQVLAASADRGKVAALRDGLARWYDRLVDYCTYVESRGEPNPYWQFRNHCATRQLNDACKPPIDLTPQELSMLPVKPATGDAVFYMTRTRSAE